MVKSLRLNKYILVSLTLAWLLLLVSPLAGAAAAKTPAKSQANTQTQSSKSTQATGNGSVDNYAADSQIQIGSIVQMVPGSTTKVELATSQKPKQMYGVVVDPHLLSVTLSNSAIKHEVYVATAGTYKVLVSNQNGAIEPGDYITISNIGGIGMGADTGAETVFGRAVGSFDGKKDVIAKATLKNTAKQPVKQVAIGMIPVAINVQRNPKAKSTKANVPNFLQRAGQAIANKPVSEARLFLGVAIAVISLIVAMVILYTGIRSSMIALGRNPLSKKTILRGLIQVIMASVIILIIGLFAVYLLVKL